MPRMNEFRLLPQELVKFEGEHGQFFINHFWCQVSFIQMLTKQDAHLASM